MGEKDQGRISKGTVLDTSGNRTAYGGWFCEKTKDQYASYASSNPVLEESLSGLWIRLVMMFNGSIDASDKTRLGRPDLFA